MNDFISKINSLKVFVVNSSGKKEPIRPELHWQILLAVSFGLGVICFVSGILLYQWISRSEGGQSSYLQKDLLINHSDLNDALQSLDEAKAQYDDLKRNPLFPREPR